MKRYTPLPELLAPAGSFEAMLAAVAAGADAVYMGGQAFGARAYARNFDADELREAVRYCHLHGVKVYVTVNTQIYDREMTEALQFCRTLYGMGADAVIAADFGLIRRLRRELPALPVHASTQMSVHNLAGAEAAFSLGAERVVLARELSERDIRYVTAHAQAEIEVFVHGAMCVCHSGQCLFSSLVGGRSGNRGACAQPCRLPYNGADKYPLSLKDMSLAQHIPALIDAGVSSLKIEGRMKSPSYVYGVTSVYRRLLDERRGATAEECAQLQALFSRGGFSDAYFRAAPDEPMTGVRSQADKDMTRATEERTFALQRVPVRASARFFKGVPCELTLTDGRRTVTVQGDIPDEARNIPLSSADLTTRLCKMGNTYLSLAEKDVDISMDDGLFLAPSAVNALRRAAVDAFTDTARPMPAAVPSEASRLPARRTPMRTALFFDTAVFRAVAAEDKAFFDVVFVPLMQYGDGAHGARGVYVPPVVTDGEWAEVTAALSRAAAQGATHALVGNVGHVEAVRAAGLVPVGDFRLNVCNADTADALRAWGLDTFLLSPELTLPMMRDVGGGAIVYGRIPLMLTERCFVKENGTCRSCGHFSLTDRKGKRFPILREYRHRNLILNAVTTYMGDRRDKLRACGLVHEHFLFTSEDAATVHTRIAAYRTGATPAFEVRRL